MWNAYNLDAEMKYAQEQHETFIKERELARLLQDKQATPSRWGYVRAAIGQRLVQWGEALRGPLPEEATSGC